MVRESNTYKIAQARNPRLPPMEKIIVHSAQISEITPDQNLLIQRTFVTEQERYPGEREELRWMLIKYNL